MLNNKEGFFLWFRHVMFKGYRDVLKDQLYSVLKKNSCLLLFSREKSFSPNCWSQGRHLCVSLKTKLICIRLIEGDLVRICSEMMCLYLVLWSSGVS